jgi:hypothetical protein
MADGAGRFSRKVKKDRKISSKESDPLSRDSRFDETIHSAACGEIAKRFDQKKRFAVWLHN